MVHLRVDMALVGRGVRALRVFFLGGGLGGTYLGLCYY